MVLSVSSKTLQLEGLLTPLGGRGAHTFLPSSSQMTFNFLQNRTSLPKLKGNVGGAGAAAAPFRAQLKSAVVSMQCYSRVEGKGAD